MHVMRLVWPCRKTCSPGDDNDAGGIAFAWSRCNCCCCESRLGLVLLGLVLCLPGLLPASLPAVAAVADEDEDDAAAIFFTTSVDPREYRTCCPSGWRIRPFGTSPISEKRRYKSAILQEQVREKGEKRDRQSRWHPASAIQAHRRRCPPLLSA